MSSEYAWDEMVYKASAAYKFAPNKHSQETVLFFLFGRDVYTPLVQLLNSKLRYVCNDEILLVLNALRDVYALGIHNIGLSRKKQADKFPTYLVPEFNVGNSVRNVRCVGSKI